MPAAAAIWSTVVASNPCSENSNQACRITSSRTAPRAWSRKVELGVMAPRYQPRGTRDRSWHRVSLRRMMH